MGEGDDITEVQAQKASKCSFGRSFLFHGYEYIMSR